MKIELSEPSGQRADALADSKFLFAYNRALFRVTVRYLTPGRDLIDSRRYALGACEHAVQQIATNPERAPSAAANALFRDLRALFRANAQLDAYTAICASVDEIARLLRRGEVSRATGRCAAVTRRGRRCARSRVSESAFCPSHSSERSSMVG